MVSPHLFLLVSAHLRADHGHSHGGHSHSHSSSDAHSHGVGAIRLPEDDEETAEQSEEEVDDLYAHPAQTRANIVRAAASGHNRRRSNSTNVDMESAQGKPKSYADVLKKSNSHGLSEAEQGLGQHEGHSHANGHGHSHGDDHEEESKKAEKGHGHSHGNMNMRGVFLHVLGDAVS